MRAGVNVEASLHQQLHRNGNIAAVPLHVCDADPQEIAGMHLQGLTHAISMIL